MKRAKEYLTEMLLKQYFLFEAIFGICLSEKDNSKAFKELANIFCLDFDSQLKEHFSESQKSHYKGITDLSSYQRMRRMIEFADKCGQDIELTEIDRVILAQKQEAINSKRCIFESNNNLTREMIFTTLSHVAMNGNIDAMAILAFAEITGICTSKDATRALKRIRLCAKWNSVFGLLMGIAYDSKGIAQYYNTLYTVLKTEEQKPIYKWIANKTDYRVIPSKESAAKLIEKGFGLKSIERSTFNPAFSKIASSTVISYEDKKNILLGAQNNFVALCAELPFEVQTEDSFEFDVTPLSKIPLKRKGEIDHISKNFKVSTICSSKVYKPLYIVASDVYVSQIYCEAIKNGINKKNCIEIDAATLEDRAFFCDKDNVFLRGVNKSKTTQTLFLIKNCDCLDTNQLYELEKMLTYSYRQKFKLTSSSVTFDLSNLKFVLFSEKPISILVNACETVTASKMTKAEKFSVTQQIFNEFVVDYGVSDLVADEECLEHLAGFEIEDMKKAIDSVLREAIYQSVSVVSKELLVEICNQNNVTQGRTEFGYMGGNFSA